MASSSTTSLKALCVVCNKAKGSFICDGCSQRFCPKHSIDHRNELSKKLEEIEAAHNLTYQTLTQQTEDSCQHRLMTRINQWETESIVKIRQAAKEARDGLLKHTVECTDKMKERLKYLSDELRQARDDNDFIETDLQQWIQKLEELNNELVNPATIIIRADTASLVTKIYIDRQAPSDVFERVCGTAQITEHGYLVVKHSSDGHTEIRGHHKYNAGRHIIRFVVEQLSENGWIFFGIISKSETSKFESYSSLSSYGWSNRDQIYAAGQLDCNQILAINQLDTIILVIDCDQRKIELKYERVNRTQQLSIDINKCAFPWQLQLNLHTANTRVRISRPLV